MSIDDYAWRKRAQLFLFSNKLGFGSPNLGTHDLQHNTENIDFLK